MYASTTVVIRHIVSYQMSAAIAASRIVIKDKSVSIGVLAIGQCLRIVMEHVVRSD